MLITNQFTRYAAVCMLILQMGVVVQFGLLPAVEYLVLFGIAVFILLNNLRFAKLTELLKPYSVDALRIFTGISLVKLGFSGKLLGPWLGQSFIEIYNWNFLVPLGFDFFTDRLFVLSAGMMEVVFGIMLILGTTTRLNMLAISSFIALSNIVFLVQNEKTEALVEFVVHMPVIATALVLLLLGYGQRLKITRLLPTRLVSQKTRTINLSSEA